MKEAAKSQTGKAEKSTMSKISKLKQQREKHIVRQFNGKKMVTSTSNSYLTTLKGCAVGNLVTKLKAELDKVLLKTTVGSYEDLMNKYQLIRSYENRLSFDKEKFIYLMNKLPLMYTMVMDIANVLKAPKQGAAEQSTTTSTTTTTTIAPKLTSFFKEQATYCIEYLKMDLELDTFQAMLTNGIDYDMIAFAVPHFKKYMDSIIPLSTLGAHNAQKTNLLFVMLDRNAPQQVIELVLESGLCHPRYNTVFKSKKEMEQDGRVEADVMFDRHESCLFKALKSNRMDTYEYLQKRWNARYSLTPYEIMLGTSLKRKSSVMRFINDVTNQIKQQGEKLSSHQLLELRSSLFALVLSSARIILEDTTTMLRAMYQEGIDFELELFASSKLMDLYTNHRFWYIINNEDLEDTSENKARMQAAEDEALKLIIAEFKWDVNQILGSVYVQSATLLGILLSCSYPNYEIIKMLLERGTNLCHVDSQGYMVLHHCYGLKDDTLLDFFETAFRMGLKAEVVNNLTPRGLTVMDCAVGSFTEEVIEQFKNLIRKHGVEPVETN